MFILSVGLFMSSKWDYKNDFPLFVFNELVTVFACKATIENVGEWWEALAAVFADNLSLNAVARNFKKSKTKKKVSWKLKEKNPTLNEHDKCGFNDILNSTDRSRALNTIFFKCTYSFMDVLNESNLQLTT